MRRPSRTQAFIEALVRRLKHDPSYRIEYEYDGPDLREVAMRRLGELIRGFLIRRQFRASKGLVFAGHGVRIRHGRHISVGSSLLLGDGVMLDGMSLEGITLGDNVTVARGAVLGCTGVLARPGVGIRVGDRCGIGDHCYFSGQGGIEVGSDVLFGPSVRIFSENHRFDNSELPIRQQGEVRAPVVIEGDCWIGADVTIVGGVRIGRGSVVAAGAVVTRDVLPHSVVAGVPARFVRSRFDRPAKS